jgi:hypothetical protein
MKKALAILMIFALVASVAVAEVSIGAWGRGIFLPVNNNGDDTITDTAPSWGGWGGDEARIGFTIAGNSDNVGFQIDGNVDGGSFNVGDQQKIWIKPMDMVTVQLGRIYDDTLRGNAAFGSFNWYRGLGNGDGEDITFSRIGVEGSREAFQVAIAPMDELYVSAYFYDLDKDLLENMFSKMQFAVGYSIDGIGQFKAQVLTSAVYETVATSTYEIDQDTGDIVSVAGTANTNEVAETGAKVEVAFNYTGMENLFVEAGFGMETNDKVDPLKAKDINIYARYGMDDITLHFLSMNSIIDVGDTEVNYKMVVGVDYNIGDGLAAAADFGFTGTTIDDVDAEITGFAGVTKGFSNGVIGAGVQFKNDGNDTFFGIPVRMEYWF